MHEIPAALDEKHNLFFYQRKSRVFAYLFMKLADINLFLIQLSFIF